MRRNFHELIFLFCYLHDPQNTPFCCYRNEKFEILVLKRRRNFFPYHCRWWSSSVLERWARIQKSIRVPFKIIIVWMTWLSTRSSNEQAYQWPIFLRFSKFITLFTFCVTSIWLFIIIITFYTDFFLHNFLFFQ